MVYPVLKINQNDLTSTIIITETQYDNELTLSKTADDTPTLFLALLEMFMCQYDSGYEDGYMEAIDDQDEQDEEYDII